MAIPYSRYIVGGLPWYSVLIVAGILLAYWLGSREEKRVGLPKDAMLDMTLVAVPCGIVGARLYYVLMELDQFAAHPISALYIWEGGIAIYGAILGGAIGVYCYARKKKRSFGAMLDMAAPGLALAQAVGRWGNYFNQEAFGPAIANPAWQFFPAGVLIGEGGALVWHQATFFYESLWDVGCFIALMALRGRERRRGDLFLWYAALYGSGRFLIEQLRTDSLYIGSIRASQYLSLIACMCVAGAFAARCWKARGRREGLGMALLCALAFARTLLAGFVAGRIVTVALYAACAVWLMTNRRKAAAALLLADAAVYAGLWIAGLAALWQSPYFVYFGLTLPVYLAAPYARLPRPAEATL